MGYRQLIAVPGTHAWRGPDGAGDWYHPGSPVLAYLASIPLPGTIALADPAHPFVERYERVLTRVGSGEEWKGGLDGEVDTREDALAALAAVGRRVGAGAGPV